MDKFDGKSGDLLRIGMFSEKITVLCEDNFRDKRDPDPRGDNRGDIGAFF